MVLHDFVSIATYGNANWNGKFSQQEVEAYAKDLYADFLCSIENHQVSSSILSLCENLAEDIKNMPTLEDPKFWLKQISASLGIMPIN